MKYRRAVLCVFLVVACVVVDATDKGSEKNKKVRGKIVGGNAVDISKAAYTASLFKASTNEHFCGGSIIHPSFILTAAHCVSGMRAGELAIRTGSSYSDRGGEVTPVSQIIVHPQYNPKTVVHDIALVRTRRQMTKGGVRTKKRKALFENDIAILKLICPISFNNGTKMIRLARSSPTVGNFGLVTGWGVEHENGVKASKLLNYVWLPFIEQSVCRSAYARLNPVTDNMICAGYAAGGKDACQGDSGGPLVSGVEQVGVVSWGRGCARSGSPGVFTFIPNYLSWIASYAPNV